MSADQQKRELVHKVNNLIGVIYTQAAVARADRSVEGMLRVIELIETAAKETAEVVQRTRGS